MEALVPIEKAILFYGFSEPELAALNAISEERPIQRGERIFGRGDDADALYLARAGKLVLTIGLRVFDDTEEMVVEELCTGDAFGWSALVEPRQWLYSAYCTAAGSLIRFPREPLEELITTHQDLGYRLRTNISELVGRRLRTLQDLWIAEVEQSTARVQHWTNNEVNRRLRKMIRPPHESAPWTPSRHS